MSKLLLRRYSDSWNKVKTVVLGKRLIHVMEGHLNEENHLQNRIEIFDINMDEIEKKPFS